MVERLVIVETLRLPSIIRPLAPKIVHCSLSKLNPAPSPSPIVASAVRIFTTSPRILRLEPVIPPIVETPADE
jgi:hypothetical protein